jgi:Tol biopolymer transport system component
MMNLDGSGLEQVTDFGGFTSFPEFSPDGKTLVFCSDRDSEGLEVRVQYLHLRIGSSKQRAQLKLIKQ